MTTNTAMKWFAWIAGILIVALLVAVVYLFIENHKIRGWARHINKAQIENIEWEKSQSDLICFGLRNAVYEGLEGQRHWLEGRTFCGTIDPTDPPGEKCDLFQCEEGD